MKEVRIGLVMPQDLKDRVDDVAKKEDRTFSAQVRKFLQDGCDKEEAENA